jgi:hypothetical protein
MLETKGGAGATGCALCASACCDNGGNDAGKVRRAFMLAPAPYVSAILADSSATGSAAQMGQNMANIARQPGAVLTLPPFSPVALCCPQQRAHSIIQIFSHQVAFNLNYISKTLQAVLTLSFAGFFLACDARGMSCALHDIMFFYHSQSVRTAINYPLCKSPSTAC